MAVSFHIEGPFEIPFSKSNQVKMIDEKGLSGFWNPIESSKKKGCYVFAIRASKGIIPYYVGKATKTFKQECFQAHKLSKHYNKVLHELGGGKGTPCLFLVSLQNSKGKVPISVINTVEKDLIAFAHRKNDKLSNIQSLPKDKKYLIKNVLHSGSGKPNKGEGSFKSMLGI